MGILVLARVAGKSIQGGEQGPAGATGERLIRAGIRETRWGPTAAGAPHDVSQTGGRISVTRSRPRWQTGQRSISSPVRRSIRARAGSGAGGGGGGGRGGGGGAGAGSAQASRDECGWQGDQSAGCGRSRRGRRGGGSGG